MFFFDTPVKKLKFGLPSRGLVSLIVPGWDVRGRNILPLLSDDFAAAHGWSAVSGATVNVYAWDDATYPAGLDPDGGHNAYRIRTTGGSSANKYTGLSSLTSVNTAGYPQRIQIKNIGANAVKFMSNSGAATTTVNGGSSVFVIAENEGVAIGAYGVGIGFRAVNIADELDFIAYQPQINFASLAPYSAPLGLPQTLSDYSSRGNGLIRGATTAVGADDPTLSASGVTFGADDFCKSASAVFDDMAQFTVVTALKCPNATATQRIWDKSVGGVYDALAINNTRKLDTYRCQTASHDEWIANTAMTAGENYIIGQMLNRSNALSEPVEYVNTTKQILTRSASGSGGVLSNAAVDLCVGNRLNADRSLASDIYCMAWYNRILSDSEYRQAYKGMQRLCAAMGITV